jgi:hypothetical protein
MKLRKERQLTAHRDYESAQVPRLFVGNTLIRQLNGSEVIEGLDVMPLTPKFDN